MPSLPRTPTGKISRKDLPEPEKKRPELSVPYYPPTTQLEREIVSIWEKILQIEGIGIEDNFFDLGGDSLSSVIMSIEVEKLIKNKFPQAFFKSPTVRNLVEMQNAPIEKGQLPTFQLTSYKKDQQNSEKINKKERTKAPHASSRTPAWISTR